MPEIPDLEVLLSDGVVTLRMASERDIPEILIAYQDDPQLHSALGRERPPSGAQLGRASERAGADRASGRGVTLTILESGSDTCRGQLRAEPVDWERGRTELEIWLVPHVRGRGYGPRALRLAADWLLGACGLEAVCSRASAGAT
ncbi:MAG: GNAT family N-acetyltransferase [Actinomycetota bacterium]|nr:GNAT family N-acetyltransferase [Actinomycetota bacterium]